MDVPFTVIHFRKTPFNLCKLIAATGWHGSLELSVVRSKISKLLRWWRLRTVTFKEKGLFVSNPVRVQYLRNCPPSLGTISSKNVNYVPHLCRHYVCPWCWNRRYCANIFKVLTRHIRSNPDTSVYCLQKTVLYGASDYSNAAELLRAHSKHCLAISLRLRRRKHILGGMHFSYLVPSEDGFKLVTKFLLSSTSELKNIDELLPVLVSTSPRSPALFMGSYPFQLLKSNYDSAGLCKFMQSLRKTDKRFIRFGKLYKEN